MLAKLQQRHWRAWLAVVGLGYVILEAARSQVSDASTLIVVWIGKSLFWLIRQPMGFGGLAIVVYIFVLLGSSWWQTRPKPQLKQPAVPELTEAERRILQDFRTVWNRHGHEAVSQMHDLLRGAVYDLKKRAYWGVLLDPLVADLHQSMERMGESVAFGSSLPVGEVRERFNVMYAAYLKAIKWFANLQAQGDVPVVDEQIERLSWWRASHYRFRDKLEDLNQTPEHHRSLKIYLNYIDDPAFARLLRDAEKPSVEPGDV